MRGCREYDTLSLVTLCDPGLWFNPLQSNDNTDEENNEKRIAHSSTRRAIFLSLQFLSLQKSEGQHPVPAFLNFH